VPLLRAGFRPDGPYMVSFVYLHAGTAFARKGEMQMTLPRMDLPVGVVEWELFMPDQYRADRFAGSAIAAHLLGDTTSPQLAGNIAPLPLLGAGPGQIVGRITDSSGVVIPGATVIATVQGQRREARSLADGSYAIYGLPAGPMTVSSQIQGFKTTQRTLVYDERPRQIDFQLEVGGVTETVTVSGDAPVIDKQSEEANRPRSLASVAGGRGGGTGNARGEDRQQAQESQAPSVNVQNLQRRASGVLPVRIDVPRAGTSHRFVKPLVIDEETVVRFRYRRK
jgi:hypothetical protein